MKSNDAEAIERAIDEYQRSQREWLREYFSDEHVLLQLKRLNHDARSKLVQHALIESGAHAHLDQLVAKGCDRRHMIDLLVLMDSNELPPRWLGLRNRAELRRAVTKLAEAERVVRAIQPQISGLTILAATWAWFAAFPLLPNLLESYGTCLKFFADSTESQTDMPRTLLVEHVVERTGAPCDREVAAIIAALPGRGGYSVEAHAKWRARHDVADSAVANDE